MKFFDGKGNLATRCLMLRYGPDYVEDTFRIAQEAIQSDSALAKHPPMMVLNEEFGLGAINLEKAKGVFAFVQQAEAKGIKIDAVGIQNHISLSKTTPEAYLQSWETFLQMANQAGVPVLVTEADVGIKSLKDPTDDQLKEQFEQQKTVYKGMMKLYLKYQKNGLFVVWGLSDKYNWRGDGLDEWDTKPLLFDDFYQRKPAYYGLIEAMREYRAELPADDTERGLMTDLISLHEAEVKRQWRMYKRKPKNANRASQLIDPNDPNKIVWDPITNTVVA